MPIQSKGGYQLDFDNLDAINPFQGSVKMVLSPARPAVVNSPVKPAVENPATEPQHTKPENISEEPTKIESALDETLPFTPSVENSLVDVSTNISSTESSVVTVMKVSAVEEQDSCAATPDEKQPPNINEDGVSGSFVEDAPLPAKGSYTLDFDNLDAFNPFQTGGSKIQNSPVVGRKVPDINPATVEEIKEDKTPNVEVAQEALVKPEMKPVAAVAPISTNATETTAAESQPTDAPIKEGPVILEFNFDDGNEVKKKPPPKKFGKRPPGLKPKEGKPPCDVKKAPKETPVKPVDGDVADVPVPKGAYSFDFDKFDDPNFNPFGTKASMSNSPQCGKKSSPVLTETPIPEQPDEPVEKEAASSSAWYVLPFYLSVYLQWTLHLPETLNFKVFMLFPCAAPEGASQLWKLTLEQ